MRHHHEIAVMEAVAVAALAIPIMIASARAALARKGD